MDSNSGFNSREVARKIVALVEVLSLGKVEAVQEALDSALLAEHPEAWKLAIGLENIHKFGWWKERAASLLAAALESARREAVPQWISVKERLPEDGQRVIYYFAPLGVFVGTYTRLQGKAAKYGSDQFYGPNGFLTDDVTHWMPLPSVDSLAEKEGGR